MEEAELWKREIREAIAKVRESSGPTEWRIKDACWIVRPVIRCQKCGFARNIYHDFRKAGLDLVQIDCGICEAKLSLELQERYP